MASRQIVITVVLDNKEAVNQARAFAIALRALRGETEAGTQVQNGLTNSFIKGNLAARAISVTYNLLKDSFKMVVKSAAELEFTMAKIQALSGSSDAATRAFSDSIMRLSLASSKSAVDIAKASLEMNKMGLTVPQVRLLMGSVVALSTALDEDLVKSGETVVNILNAYGDSVLMGQKRTEELAFTVGASALNMQSFSTAFAYVGATAHLAGVKFEDLTAAMDVLSNAGIRSSTIGTQLRRVIADLSDENSKGSKAIGGTIESLGGLIPAMEKLRQVTPKGDAGVAFLTQTFGRTATSVAALLALNSNEMERLSKATDDSTGSLDRMQGIVNDTFLAKWEHFLNITKSLGSGPLLILKAGLSGVNDALDSMVGAYDRVVKSMDVTLHNAETKNSVAHGGGFGDLRTLDEAKLKAQLPETEKLTKGLQEMVGVERLKNAEDTLDRIKTDFEVFKTFGGGFDLSGATKQLTDLANSLLKMGDSKEAVKVMKELRAIQDDKSNPDNPNGGRQIDFQKVAGSAISKRLAREASHASEEEYRARKDSDRYNNLKATGDSILAHADAYSADGMSKTDKLKEFEAGLSRYREQYKGHTDIIKSLDKQVSDYKKQLDREDFQRNVGNMAAIAGSTASFLDAMSVAYGHHGKKNRDLAIAARTVAVAEVIMNTAVAVSKVWGQTGIFGILAQAAPIAAGAASIAQITSTKLATGADQVVRSPTMFMAGEAGAERVRVTPRGKMSAGDSEGGMTIIIQGDVYDYDRFQRKVKQAQASNTRAFV